MKSRCSQELKTMAVESGGKLSAPSLQPMKRYDGPEAVAKALTLTAVQKGIELSAERLKMYLHDLRDLEAVDVVRAIGELRLSQKFFPDVSEIRLVILGKRNWSGMEDLITRYWVKRKAWMETPEQQARLQGEIDLLKSNPTKKLFGGSA
jgi:hypothetical protein